MLTLDSLTDKDLRDFFPIPLQKEEFETIRDLFYGKEKSNIFVFKDTDGVPVLITGVMEKWPRVYDTATVYSAAWRPVYFKHVLKKAKLFFSSFDCDRIEHMVHCDRPWTDKLAQAFGFKFNTVVRKAYNGKDFKLYEIVNG